MWRPEAGQPYSHVTVGAPVAHDREERTIEDVTRDAVRYAPVDRAAATAAGAWPAGLTPGPAGLSAKPATSVTDPGGPQRRSSRLPALDGLRGVAALVVLVFHVLLLSPVFADPAPGVRPEEPSWWLTHTPLYLFWAGPQAVFLFFVLSGFVLALPATVAQVRWRSYYPQRLVRLYLPVWASLLFAAALAAAVPRPDHAQLSEWYESHVPVVGPGEAVRDGLLVVGAGWLNSPLWSLQWEVLFSLLLPLYLLLARSFRRLWALKLLGLLLVVAAAQYLWRPEVLYLSMFGFGVLMAFERDRLAAAARSIAGARTGPLLAGACVLLLTVEVALLVAGVDGGTAAAVPLQMLGACLAVALALHWEPARRRLSSPWAQWVGVRSFSLYLVHEPLAVTSGALWPGLPVLVHLAIVLPVSLLVAHAFHRIVESPAHRLSRAAARRFA